MTEKLCLKWNDFQENIRTSFGICREDKDFSDITLVCEDDVQVDAHKLILAASSPVFKDILKRAKHPNPLIYMRGLKSVDLVAILDFLYLGEAQVGQENLESFLALAEELKLKGLTQGESSNADGANFNSDDVKVNTGSSGQKRQMSAPTETKYTSTNKTISQIKPDKALQLPLPTCSEEQSEWITSVMEKSQLMIPNGKHCSGKVRYETAHICKVCGKEGKAYNIKKHIQSRHFDDASTKSVNTNMELPTAC